MNTIHSDTNPYEKEEITANQNDVLEGKTYYDSKDNLETGSMPKVESKNVELKEGETYKIPSGYHDGSSTVTALESDKFKILEVGAFEVGILNSKESLDYTINLYNSYTQDDNAHFTILDTIRVAGITAYYTYFYDNKVVGNQFIVHIWNGAGSGNPLGNVKFHYIIFKYTDDFLNN